MALRACFTPIHAEAVSVSRVRRFPKNLLILSGIDLKSYFRVIMSWGPNKCFVQGLQFYKCDYKSEIRLFEIEVLDQMTTLVNKELLHLGVTKAK